VIERRFQLPINDAHCKA
jgi:hypothetical protein